MPDVGDQVRIASTKVGEAPREGVVTSVIGRCFTSGGPRAMNRQSCLLPVH